MDQKQLLKHLFITISRWVFTSVVQKTVRKFLQFEKEIFVSFKPGPNSEPNGTQINAELQKTKKHQQNFQTLHFRSNQLT
jgi:hypothetical protein